ncbi:MAG: SAM-dependent methyltransferase [Clostridia bacterium]|nr:SAM-dependent methyltransferase [Clostridia bacterium]
MKKISKRLEKIFSYLTSCEYLADVGCDHGYIAKLALDSGIAKKVCISDISEKSLNKAINLLSDYGDEKVFSVVSDGLELVPNTVDQVLIAGMGGEEIVKILSSSHFLPKKLVLSPMKNGEKVRKLLIELGYEIVHDTIFSDGDKFYFLITADFGGKSVYTDMELEFGKESLKSKVLVLYLDQKIANLEKSFDRKSEKQKEKIQSLTKIRNEINRNL